MKLASWNINGLRAVSKKGYLADYLRTSEPDILCLQEVKIKDGQADIEFEGYKLVLNSAKRPGYSGTGFLVSDRLANQAYLIDNVVRDLPQSIAEKYNLAEDSFGDTNSEGRVMVLDLGDYFLVTVYTPNSKGNLARLAVREKQWDPAYLEYITDLMKIKPVVFCGDLNVAAEEIDLANPKQNVGKHGFTNEERRGFANMIKSGLIDSFRFIHGNIPNRYTWWTHWANARARNVGWRIDYFMVDNRLADRIKDAEIIDQQLGSDHCPVELVIE